MNQSELPLLDCPADYLIGDASGKLMNEYCRFPCKINCGVFILLTSGTAKASVNVTEYQAKANDLFLLQPGSFVLIDEFSDDAHFYYIALSSKFLERNTYSSRLTLLQGDISSPLLHLTEEVAKVVKGAADLLIAASNCQPPIINSTLMGPIFNLFQTAYNEFMRMNPHVKEQPQDRRTEIYQEYNALVMRHYREWHHVSQYADAMRLTLPHVCSTIKSVSGKTAGDIIIDAILTDAKSQLKITNLQVKEIALSLGFDNVAFFNRFFKAHTGMTPKTYRLS